MSINFLVSSNFINRSNSDIIPYPSMKKQNSRHFSLLKKVLNKASTVFVIPAKLVPAGSKQGAGIQLINGTLPSQGRSLDSRLRGNDGLRDFLKS